MSVGGVCKYHVLKSGGVHKSEVAGFFVVMFILGCVRFYGFLIFFIRWGGWSGVAGQ